MGIRVVHKTVAASRSEHQTPETQTITHAAGVVHSNHQNADITTGERPSIANHALVRSNDSNDSTRSQKSTTGKNRNFFKPNLSFSKI